FPIGRRVPPEDVFAVGAALVRGLTAGGRGRALEPPAGAGQAEAKTVYLTRHAEAEHNVRRRYYLRDPRLTDRGRQQAAVELPRSLRGLAPPGSAGGKGEGEREEEEEGGEGGPALDLIVTSPLKRTLQTSLLGYRRYVDAGVPVVVLPELQELGALPADTGSPLADLEAEFPRLSFERLEEIERASGGRPWYEKRGDYAPTLYAVARRTRRLVSWLLARPEENIAVVTHSGLLHWILRQLREFRNAEVRRYALTLDRKWKLEGLKPSAGDERGCVDDAAGAREVGEICKRSV
ncbi:MAG: histidine phosphatase superfamily, partial [Olpidium bornovanus]